ncbi:MAG: hypothetical protein PVJ86_02535 [Phycisphaerales bacterium]|jgi:hypothetical protein
MTNASDCQNRREMIAALVLGELQPLAADEIREHFDTCWRCRCLYQALVEEEETIRSAFKAIDDMSKAIGNNLVVEYNKVSRAHDDISAGQAESQAKQSAITLPNVWRTIMKSPIRSLAAAAVIIVAALYGLNVIGNGGNVLAEVLDNVNQIRSFAYRIKIRAGQHGGSIGMKDDLIWGKHVLESRDHGRRIFSYWIKGPEGIPVKTMEPYSKLYVLKPQAILIGVRPDEKKFWRRRLTDVGFLDWEESTIFPSGFTEHPYTRLGRDMINGVTVEGYESTHPRVVGRHGDPRIVARLWVDTKTKLPVRMEIEDFLNSRDGSPTKRRILDGFEWNVEIYAADFDPNIPDDFEFVPEAEKLQPPIDEQQMVEAFRFFAKLTDGKYPSDLSGRNVYEELNAAWISKHGVPLPEQCDREDIRKTLWLDATIGWYDSLRRQGKDPAYYGHIITAKSPHAVLMRWKMDDELYRVIFGSLTIGEATADELAELEKSLPE